MRRYFARVGDETTSGGRVLEGIPNYTILGKNATFHGAMVSCPKCNTIGRIFGKGPRRPFKAHGKEVALGGDICLCKCDPPPQIIPSQDHSSMTVESEPAVKPVYGTSTSSAAAPSLVFAPPLYNDKFLLLDDQTGRPLAGVEYAVKRKSGEIEYGITDNHGHTHLIDDHDSPEEVVFYCNGMETT